MVVLFIAPIIPSVCELTDVIPDWGLIKSLDCNSSLNISPAFTPIDDSAVDCPEKIGSKILSPLLKVSNI